MLFSYKAIDKKGARTEGNLDAVNADLAILTLQKRGLIVSDVVAVTEERSWQSYLPFFGSVPQKDVVAFSQQVATLFGSQVSTLKIFRMLADESENPVLKRTLYEISDKLQEGGSIANAFAKYPSIFSSFYINMIRAGEESGKISETFEYLAQYLDRTYEITTRTRNALIYPAFVITTFIAVIAVMFVVVIPKIQTIIVDSNVAIPIYTQVIFGASAFLIQYGFFLLLILIALLAFFFYYRKTEQGRIGIDKFKLGIPIVGTMYTKLYLSRIADNMSTMIQSGIPIVRSLEIASDIVDNEVYRSALSQAVFNVKGGKPVSNAFEKEGIFPGIMVAMIRVGEETGELRGILEKLASFYKRELIAAVDTLIELIEPAMIVVLGVSVGFLLASVLVPIYSISTSLGG